jgi:TrmH family RNA methyltransferase
MPLSKNTIKHFSSLKIKKFRDAEAQFLIEGDKTVKDLLNYGQVTINHLIATDTWLGTHKNLLTPLVKEVHEADVSDIARISSFETPPPVMAVINLPDITLDIQAISHTLSIALDNIQDPGNLGTIIRTANWFGIRNIICSNDCADCYNPKSVQASMGSVVGMNFLYTDLLPLLTKLSVQSSFPVYGTFMSGVPVFDIPKLTKGILLFGNEARGISKELIPFIKTVITIPSANPEKYHVESLNVASAVAIVCAVLVHPKCT